MRVVVLCLVVVNGKIRAFEPYFSVVRIISGKFICRNVFFKSSVKEVNNALRSTRLVGARDKVEMNTFSSSVPAVCIRYK
jgi:hypothetical protein